MKTKVNRLFFLMMTIILLFSLSVEVSASVLVGENVVQPRLQYTNYTSTSINESPSGTALCGAGVEGYSGITTRIHIKMELQKFGTVKWETVTTWESTVFTYYSTLSKTKAVTVSGLYRVKATYTVYGGSAYETITSYSPEKFITKS